MSENAINGALRRLGYATDEEMTGHGFRAMARTILDEVLGYRVEWGAKVALEGGERLVGQNVLGRLLMELREQLLSQEMLRLKTVHPINIPDFSLLGAQIGDVAAEPGRHPKIHTQSMLF